MSKVDDGGPAFPVPGDANMNEQVGMSLRDWFAANASLTDHFGLESMGTAMAEHLNGSDCPEGDADRFAWWAAAYARFRYIMADAMLKARGQ
jgi:hypothetical protein